MLISVTQVEPVAKPGERTMGDPGGEVSATYDLGALPPADDAAKVGNPAQLSGQMASGLHALLQQSESINRLVGQDLTQATSRIHARESGLSAGGAGLVPQPGQVPLPGPAERHPGISVEDRWGQLQDAQDRAFVRYTEFAAYELQSNELQKITEQLSNAVNSLVRSS